MGANPLQQIDPIAQLYAQVLAKNPTLAQAQPPAPGRGFDQRLPNPPGGGGAPAPAPAASPLVNQDPLGGPMIGVGGDSGQPLTGPMPPEQQPVPAQPVQPAAPQANNPMLRAPSLNAGTPEAQMALAQHAAATTPPAQPARGPSTAATGIAAAAAQQPAQPGSAAPMQPGAPPPTYGVDDPRGVVSRLLGLPQGVSNGIGDAMAGLAKVDPTQPALIAAAQGFAGARGAGQSREDRKREQVMAAEEKSYDRGRNAAADSRAASAEARSEESHRLAIQKTQRDLKREAAQVGVDADEMVKIGKAVDDRRKALVEQYKTEVSAPTEEQIQQIEGEVKEYQTDLLRRAATGGGAPAGAPTATGKDGSKVYWDGSNWLPLR